MATPPVRRSSIRYGQPWVDVYGSLANSLSLWSCRLSGCRSASFSPGARGRSQNYGMRALRGRSRTARRRGTVDLTPPAESLPSRPWQRPRFGGRLRHGDPGTSTDQAGPPLRHSIRWGSTTSRHSSPRPPSAIPWATVCRLWPRAATRVLNDAVRDEPVCTPRCQLGALSFLHRFGPSLNTHFHFHLVVLDGVFSRAIDGTICVRGVRLYHHQALYKEPSGGVTPWHADQYYWPLASDRCCTV